MTRINSSTLARASAVTLAAVLATAAVAQQPHMPSMSQEISYGTYTEQAGRVQLFVGTVVAGVEADAALIPFQIALGVSGKGPELQVQIGNFELSDSEGNVYQAAKPQDVANAGLNQMVQNWVAMEPLQVGNAFATSHPTASNFYTTLSTAETQVFLDQSTHIEDVLYFPRPKDLEDEMILAFYAKGMKEGAVNVRFKIAAMKKKHKKTTKKAKG